MTMKKFDLEKNKALKLTHALKASHSDRFGAAAGAAPVDRREQRKLDQAKGLVPFACKLDGELVKLLKERAETDPEGLTGVVEALLRAGLAASDAKS